jgi:hypothetical protein
MRTLFLYSAVQIFVAMPAAAQTHMVCGPHAEIVAQLEDQYGERQVGIGVSKFGVLIEIFVSPAGTFTILKTAPNGPTCLDHAGDGWEVAGHPKQGA